MTRAVTLILCVTTILTMVASTRAASSPHQRAINWNEHDAAVYVVSTLNLVHVPGGRTLPAVLRSRVGVRRFDVDADLKHRSLFFVQLVTGEASVAGAVAYQMGWMRPRSVSPLTDQLGVQRASIRIVNDYKTDAIRAIGSFTTTLPQ